MRRQETMPDLAFRLMAFSFEIMNLFSSPVSILDNLKIKAGDTVIDYGCGPGRYIKGFIIGGQGRVCLWGRFAPFGGCFGVKAGKKRQFKQC